MKARQITVYGIFAVILAAVIAFTACENGGGTTPPTTCTVTFNLDGGNIAGDTANVQRTVTSGGTVASMPANPSKIDNTFDGWYTQQNGAGTPFTGSTTVTADITVYAKWTPEPAFTVTFDADNGSTPTTQAVPEGGKATKPTDPSKTYAPIGLYEGTPPTACTFVEWQKADGSAWNFTTDTVTANITLKAQWTTPSPIDITDETGNNIVEKTVSYVNAHGGSAYTLVLGENVSDVAPQTLDQDNTTLTITSDGNIERKISLGSIGRLFTIGGEDEDNAHSAKLTIDGHITLEGKTDNTNNSLINVLYGGSLELKGNSKLTGNTGRGCINARGGSPDKGADVIITMSDNAEISGNSSNVFVPSGGIFMLDYVTFTMNDNATIKDNTAMQLGGGVSLSGNTGSVFIMNGGKISNNNGGNYGGGVLVNIGLAFIMNGGEISNNTATNGGGVYVSEGATLTVANEQVKAGIHSNTATDGPQVYVGPAGQNPAGTFTVGGVPAGSF